jgi:hypothetical protein
MKSKLTASAVFCAALISGCSSAPTMAVPTGEWEDFNQQPQQPQGFAPLPAIPPAAYNQGPATTVYKPTEVAAFTPPKTPGSTPVKPEAPAVVLPVVEKAPVSAQVPASTAKPIAPLPNQPSVAPGPISLANAPAPSKAALGPAAGKPAPLPTAADKTKPAPGPAALVLASAEVKPVAPLPKPPKAWVVSPQDKTIRETLAKWSASEGWTFNPLGRDYWTVPQDFDVVASDTIYGDFKDAVRKLIASTELTKTPLQPCFFSNKAVRVILINEECAAQASQGRNP